MGVFFVIILIALSWAGAYHVVVGRSRWGRLVFCLLSGIFLTIFTIFALNDPSQFTNERQDEVINRFVTHDQTAKDDAESFLADHFVLIDNAFAKQLLPGGTGRGTVAVTDRYMLKQFFTWCVSHSKDFDFVICDIGFDQADTSVQKLIPLIRRLASSNKLLLSDNESGRSLASLLPGSAKGLVTAASISDRFNAQTLVDDGQPSAAYAVYQKMDTVSGTNERWLGLLSEQRIHEGRKWSLNNFPPVLFVRDDFAQLAAKDTLSEQFPGVKNLQASNFYPLELLDTSTLAFNLNARQAERKQNIIFLGTFHGSDDLHNTIFGKFHGPAILLNTIYNLHLGTHWIRPGLILLLLVGFSITIYLITLGCLIGYDEKERKRLPELWLWEKVVYHGLTGWHIGWSRRSRHIFTLTLEVLVEIIFLPVLYLMVKVAYLTFHTILNVLPLLGLLILFRTFFISFHKLKKIKT
ncbi:hypothetical protein EOD41_04170 [Mucilaginibacter limnophilus]|uniref:CHASE2 domain-containing protein n=1 Tax=Mucilaginibacter limnophilus TaxID=1932778 RepID=A0A437MZU2_9SPHI|nr:hypothetical protein [Mucilaginibacter limnophilus]RVU03134.1 hypothetical protein EOD41_04170 [Mucilaginibacter limnophilus]